jgi:hypothetical protein
MKIWQFGGIVLLIALVAEPCEMANVRKFWAKDPGSESGLFAFEREGRVGFIDATGKVIIAPTISAPIEDVGDFSNGRARVDHQGYIYEKGGWAIKKSFWWEDDFSDGLARVEVDDPNEKNEIQGLVIDLTGNVVAKVPAFRTKDFSEGLAPYEAEGKRGIRKFEPGSFFYRDYPGLKGFLDRTGSVVIKAAFADTGPFHGGLARAVVDGYCHIVTPENSREGSPTSGYPSDCGGAPADAVAPCKAGFINQKGVFVIQPLFEAAQDFQEDLAAVRAGGKWGFINREGVFVIPPRFDQTQSFQEGLAAVMIDGKWGFIDRTGSLRIPPQFSSVESFSDSLAIAYDGQRPFFIDRSGKTRIKGAFREVTPFVQGLAAVRLTEKHVAYINHEGKTVFDYFRH